MKREFLQGILTDGNPLPKEAVDAIMAENGRDIEKIKALYADYSDLKSRAEKLDNAESREKQLQQEAEHWKQELENAQRTSEQKIQRLEFNHCVSQVISQMGGRSIRAITALLDEASLMASEDRPAAIMEAVTKLRQEQGYLFQDPIQPSAYAEGTGSYIGAHRNGPATLAGALRDKYERMN